MKLMLFGDSHLAAVKRGLAGIPADRLAGVEVQFWGTAGHRFRQIDWTDGKIVPTNDSTANAFARFNRYGLRELDPALSDAVAFVGARIRPGAVIPDLLNQLVHPDRYLSRAYLKAVLADLFNSLTTYRMARAMAATGRTRVFVAPISLETHRHGKAPRAYTLARRASRADLELLWSIMAEIMADDGIGAVLQPLDSVVCGYMTDEVYGLPAGDDVHKNAAYGTLILQAILDAASALAPTAGPDQ